MSNQINSNIARPFIKWAGGKHKILFKLKNYLPTSFNTYYEPFVGGGALFLHLQPKQAYISDLNRELIITYRVIQQNVWLLIEQLKIHQTNHNQAYFYQIRSNQFPLDWIQIASRFIYLNKTCYNGLYRVNKKGELNCPIGKYKNPTILDEKNLLLCDQYLQHVNIKNKSFETIRPKKLDFVYFDPPYDAVYNGYNSIRFDQTEQQKLKAFCDHLTEKGVFIMLSNTDNRFIRTLYNHYNRIPIEAPTSINCKKEARHSRTEMLITNNEINK